jgi:hypothetical protein
MSRNQNVPEELPIMRQLDEAFGLLVNAGLPVLAGYAAATLPFLALAGLWWADVSWGVVSTAKSHLWAIVLLSAFILMRCGHAWFMAQLWRRMEGRAWQPWTRARWMRVASHAVACQPMQILALLPAAILTFPLPVVLAWGHTASLRSAIGEEPLHEAQARSFKLSIAWFSSLSTGQFLVLFGGIMLALNLLVAALLLVYLLSAFTGSTIAPAIGPMQMLNTTTWIWILLTTYFLTDPLLRAWMTRRLFLLEARADGADLRSTIAELRSQRASLILRIGALALALLMPMQGLRAEEPPPPSVPASGAFIQPEELRRSLERTLASPEFLWRLPPPPKVEQDSEESTFGQWIKDRLTAFRDFVRRLISRLERNGQEPSGDWSFGTLKFGELTLYAIIFAASIILLWLLFRNLRSRSQTTPVAKVAGVSAAPTAKDLESPETTASDQPSNAWSRLAEELASKGEWRLSMRAWHLASIAHLGERGYLSIRRSKSDRDYARELARRGQAGVTDRFLMQSGLFAERWYGRKTANEETVRFFSRPWDTA